MARVVKKQEHAVKRNEILDATQRLVYSKGYEQMSIQDILNDLQMSKGAFYHYFDSKQALLEALVVRMVEEADRFLDPILADPALSALEKFQRYFSSVASWKTAQKDFILALLRVWYTDNNAVVRQKMVELGGQHAARFLSAIIQQGIREGVLATPFPDRIGEVVYAIMVGLSDRVAQFLLGEDTSPAALAQIAESVAAHTEAIERLLGAPQGSLPLFDAAVLKVWVA
jgi:AcrR family transcriptional regulator